VSDCRLTPNKQCLNCINGLRVVANKEATEPRVPRGLIEVITSNVLRSPP
jgi:hypothetical protein